MDKKATLIRNYELFANFCANMLTIELPIVILKSSKYKCGAGVLWCVFLIYPGCDGPGSLLYRSREIQLEMMVLIGAVVRIILLRTAAFFVLYFILKG